MTRSLAAMAAAAAIATACPAAAGVQEGRTSVPTNMEMLETLARRVVDGSLDVAPLGSGDVVLIRRSGSHFGSWIVENYLAGRLAALGLSVYVKAEAPDTSASPPAEERRGKIGNERQAENATEARTGADTTAAGERGSSGGGGFESKAYVPAGGAPTPDKVFEFRVGELDVAYGRRWRKSLFGSPMVERAGRAAIFFRLMDGKDGRVLWTQSNRLEQRDVVSQKMLAALEDVPGRKRAKNPSAGGIGRIVEPIVVSGIVVGLVFLFYSSRT